jgi:trimeric autotransporter adhesin
MRSFLACGVIAAAALTAQGAVLSNVSFNSPIYSDGAIIGQDGWLITGTSTVNPINVTNTATDGVVPLTTTGQDVRRPFTTAVSPSDTSIYYSLNVNLSAAQATGDYFAHLGDGGTSLFYGRLFAKSEGAGFVLGLTTSSGTPTYGTTVLSFGTEYQIVARYDVVSGGTTNDTGALYVNPTSATEGSNTLYVAGTTVGTDATGITAFTHQNLRQGAAANAPTLTVDDFRVATTFAEAAAIPEPASLAVLGLGSLMGLRRRRR